MSYSLNSLRGVHGGLYRRGSIGLKGTRSIDYSLHGKQKGFFIALIYPQVLMTATRVQPLRALGLGYFGPEMESVQLALGVMLSAEL